MTLSETQAEIQRLQDDIRDTEIKREATSSPLIELNYRIILTRLKLDLADTKDLEAKLKLEAEKQKQTKLL